MKNLVLLVEYLIKPFSWRKNKKEYECKDPLKCGKFGGEMHLYKVVYYDKSGRRREYGGINAFLKKIIVGDVGYGKKEEKKKTVEGEGKKYTYRQICMQQL